MVKKFQRRQFEEIDEATLSEDELVQGEEEKTDHEIENDSDLEMVDQEGLMEENTLNSTNDVEALETLAQKLRLDFDNYLRQRGLKTGNWIENLTVVAKEGIDDKLNVDDDIRRELVL